MSLVDYSAMEKDITSAPEPTVIPKDSEVKARIIGVNSGISDKNNAAWYMPRFDVPSEPNSKEFNAFFWDLADLKKLEPKQAAAALRDFKNFAAAFGLDYSRPFSWEDDLPGLEGWIIVGVKKSDEYGDQNTVKKYLSKGGATAASAPRGDDDPPF
jgi:hypothetical protein